MTVERLIKVCEEVAFDVENDAKEFDGKPFSGKIVAEYFGNHGAAIKALADVIKEILQSQQPKEAESDAIEFVWTDELIREMIYLKLPLPNHYATDVQKCIDEFKLYKNKQ